jgi:hypothetical protein
MRFLKDFYSDSQTFVFLLHLSSLSKFFYIYLMFLEGLKPQN